MGDTGSDQNRMRDWSQRGELDSMAGVNDDGNQLAPDASINTDDDNWSQQVETDEILRMSSSAILDDVDSALNASVMEAASASSLLSNNAAPPPSAAANLAPKREEPTLKEKLVERERQRRVETERARLKLQFALSSNEGGAIDEDDAEQEGSSLRENGSVAGTIGEGSVIAHLEPDDEEGQDLTYPMARFLQEQGAASEVEAVREISRDNGVLMERFLKEPVVVADPQGPSDGSVVEIGGDNSYEPDHQTNNGPLPDTGLTISPSNVDRAIAGDPAIAIMSEGLSGETNGSLRGLSASDSSDEPRFLRLTEAEIQEMASIDEMSRSNAPPSDRDDDISFVAELISDFGGPAVETLGSASQGTTTTAMESASAEHSHSGRDVSPHGDSNSLDALATASISSHVFSSTGTSIAANPPSDIGLDDQLVSPFPNNLGNTNHPVELPPGGTPSAIPPSNQIVDPGPSNDLRVPGPTDEVIVNRQIRPGMVNARRIQRPPSTPMRRSSSAPALEVDGFDFDKFCDSPAASFTDQDHDPSDLWSPGTNLSYSPPHRRSGMSSTLQIPEFPSPKRDYGSFDDRNQTTRFSNVHPTDVRQPLLREVRKETVASPQSQLKNIKSAHNVFDRIRSYNTTIQDNASTRNHGIESSFWHSSLHRAFPQRMMVLSLTLLVELPVLLAISGGSDHLCSMLGRSKYQLLVGFLPMCTALSGNVGLQSSAATLHAILEGVFSREKFGKWILREMGASLCQGVAVGAFVGAIAFFLSGFHFGFALTISIAQIISIISGALIGTTMPVISTHLFGQKAWSFRGVLETSLQDLIGAFILVITCYKVFSILGPMEVDPNDSCGANL